MSFVDQFEAFVFKRSWNDVAYTSDIRSLPFEYSAISGDIFKNFIFQHPTSRRSLSQTPNCSPRWASPLLFIDQTIACQVVVCDLAPRFLAIEVRWSRNTGLRTVTIGIATVIAKDCAPPRHVSIRSFEIAIAVCSPDSHHTRKLQCLDDVQSNISDFTESSALATSSSDQGCPGSTQHHLALPRDSNSVQGHSK